MNEREIETIEGLKVLIIERFDRIDKEFDDVKDRLGKIEEDVRGFGNGKPGIGVRLDRLEKAKVWIIGIIALVAASFLSGLIAHYFSLIEKLIGQ